MPRKAKPAGEPRSEPQQSGWRSRIVGQGTENPDQLLANPLNWRIHPRHQQEALQGVLDEVGWVQQVIVNQRTGHVVDGHLRVALALRREEPEVPVLYVDLSEEEERLILATLDPIAALAVPDKEKLADLMELTRGDDEHLADLLAKSHGVRDIQGLDASSKMGTLMYRVMILCDSEDQQRDVLAQVERMGWQCQALIL
jgi:hypothetical protein